MPTDPNIPDALRDWEVPPHVEPLLDYHGTRESGNRYDVMNGGGTFDPSGPHPLARGEKGPNGQSSAAGRFQFIRDTWNSVAGEGTPMTQENQRRAAYKYATLGYKQRTGRDLGSEMAENGLTPDIASTTYDAWLGRSSSNKSPARDVLAEYGGSAPSRRESGNYQPSGGGAGDRWSEENIPYQQQATRSGLLGMLGVDTTENQRLALMKAGFRTMQTPGVLGKAIGAGGEAYVDTLMALNKQQAEIAGMQTTGKMNEASGVRSRAEAEREKAQATKTAREAEFIGKESSLSGVQVPEYDEANKVKGYKRLPFDQSSQGSGSGFVDPSILKTFTHNGKEQSAVNAPDDPIDYAPEVLDQISQLGSVSTSKDPSNNKFKVIQDLGSQDYAKLAAMPGEYGRDAATSAKNSYDAQKANYEQAASGARGNMIVNANVVRAISDIPANGALAAGKLADVRYAAANSLNTLAAMMGVQERLVPDEWKKATVADQELEKLRVLSTSANRHPNEAFGLFARQLDATANKTLQKEVANRLVATSIVMPRAALDNQNVTKHYGDVTNGFGRNLPYVINKVNPVELYERDINGITALLTAQKGTDNAIKDYVDGRIDKKTLDKLGRMYGVANLSRYFDQAKAPTARP